jgi:hypothetical protein
MQKYALDVLPGDQLLVQDRVVVVDFVTDKHDRKLISGYFDDNGNEFSLTVDHDYVVRVIR